MSVVRIFVCFSLSLAFFWAVSLGASAKDLGVLDALTTPISDDPSEWEGLAVLQLFNPAKENVAWSYPSARDLELAFEYGEPIEPTESPMALFTRRWEMMREVDRPEGEICASAEAFGARLPDAYDVEDQFNVLRLDGVFGEAWKTIEIDVHGNYTNITGRAPNLHDVRWGQQYPAAMRAVAHLILEYAQAVRYRGDADLLSAIASACKNGRLDFFGSAVRWWTSEDSKVSCGPSIRSFRSSTYPRIADSVFQALLASGVRRFEIQCARVDIRAQYSTIERLSVQHSFIDGFDLIGATLGSLEIRGSTAHDADIVLREGTLTGVTYLNLDARKLDFEAIKSDSNINIFNSDVKEINFASSSLSAPLWLADVTVEGNFNASFGHYDMLDVGTTTRGVTVGGHLWITHSSFRHVRLQDALVAGGIDATNTAIEGQFLLMNTSAIGSIRADQLRAERVQLIGVASPVVVLSRVNVGLDISIVGRFSQLWLNDARAGVVYINQLLEEYTTKAVWTDQPYSPECYPTQELEALDIRGSGTSGQHSFSDLLRDEKNCVGKLRLDGTHVAGILSIEGTVTGLVDLNDSKAQLMMFGGQRSRFGPGACITARGAQADSLLVDPDVPWIDRGGDFAPRFIDLTGADIRSIGVSYAVRELSTNRVQLAEGYLSLLAGTQDSACRDNGLESAGSRLVYRPAVFDLLASTFRDGGDADLERRVMIEKNRVYAASLLTLTDDGFWARLGSVGIVVLYFLADRFTSYGYDNVKAFLWLAGLIAAGAFISWAFIPKRRRSRLSDRRDGHKSLGYRHVFASIDRAIPSLALDLDFATYRGMPVNVARALYVQRILCFAIIAFMIAGAFNVFQ